MVCMYDGNVYAITQTELQTLDAEEMFQFFNDGHKEDIFVLYDANNQYVGAITYDSLMSSKDLPTAVMGEKLILENGFWENADAALAGQRNKVLPVFNRNMEILYLARYEEKLKQAWKKLIFLRSLDTQMSAFWDFSKHSGKHFHIVGCNMVLFAFWSWLRLQGVNVTVSGEQWRIFGIPEVSDYDSEAVLVDEKCGEIEYLYDEYMYRLKKERAELEEVLAKKFIGDIDAEDKIMFWVPDIRGVTPMYNIMSLVSMYLKQGRVCVVVMPTRDNFLQIGSHYFRNAIEFMKQIQNEGGNICSADELEKACRGIYSICYTTIINFVPMLPSVLRAKIDILTVVQPWAFFMHYYYCYNPGDDDTFEMGFTDAVRNSTDFYVSSDFMADWICQQDERWSDKVLRLGYPKQDILYHYVHEEQDIPQEWLDKTKGKRVFLFTELEESWLENIIRDDQVIIFRPHPGYLDRYGEMYKQLEESSGGRIILDDRASYNASFYLADAMITEPLCSVGINYLSMGRPMLFRSEVIKEENFRIDFRQEDWYKAAYIGESDQDIYDFMDMVRRGEDVRKEELDPYRSRMVTDFDGKVCERIYNYFENYNK